MESGDLVGAVEAWGQAARVDPAFPDPLFNLGLALAKSGDRDRAIAALERYVLMVDGERRQRGQLLLDALRRRR
jgi:Flp pilus assembly protein TadD